ncbi:bifunctional diaminohydroxyphosphoribosylaminopyrimidine deaminase/5-amino-6-(5-phosphoribosylamino)uracil reductase RibD [Pantoea ananatis]|uniref:bifunctional diaminohydroxyphosphoribosylaminopyrimidine deaminase/5-amino-6-(5-phosphoribosylamino)uracil reductase RibD n=2 Tax=Pantoea ananas TaxID=553 RepID=UPI000B7CC6AF|nr:bifunctional diaminohydroxyphosphoribosylaminopyrimidine deaminase/5-amino-6-(5-phosphoribosylamino)uracil reductase RibD [Pantoea ananatis]MCW0355430.1 Riboflavin biosynthesis protein RibD [Pantoea ananatis]USL56692.1 diaminohydroxyphosphoribosylaminopyrimidine deaminase [Pantoea ananatis]
MSTDPRASADKGIMEEKLKFMMLALEYSRQALPACRPNPPVGCVIVHDGEVVAKGFTQPPGQHHAEIDAIAKLTFPISECEIYVTLEPCSFQGRTPSCALTIAELKPKHIYIAMDDPHPKNRGAGRTILKKAGISFTSGIGKQAVERFLFPYLDTSST